MPISVNNFSTINCLIGDCSLRWWTFKFFALSQTFNTANSVETVLPVGFLRDFQPTSAHTYQDYINEYFATDNSYVNLLIHTISIN